MSKIKIAIVEDEQASRDMLARYLHDYSTEENVDLTVTTYIDGDYFLANYGKGKYDIVFMDICMPGTDGMSVARKLRETDGEVLLVFVTTMAKFAVEGYDVNAFNYIVKPVTYYDFKLKVDKAVKKLIDNDKKLRVLSEGEHIWINQRDIVYVEVIGHNLIYHTVKGDYTTYGSMKQVEQTLAAAIFARCNYCYLVNLAYVDGVKGYDLNLSDGTILRISQSKRKAFVQTLTKYFGGNL